MLFLLIFLLGWALFGYVLFTHAATTESSKPSSKTASYDGIFPPLAPKSESREHIREHRRDIQSFLMESWEVRFEEAVGATEARNLYAQHVYNIHRIEQQLSNEFHQQFPEHLFGNRERVKKQYPALVKQMTEKYNDEREFHTQKLSDVLCAYNTLMHLPFDRPIPERIWRV